MYLICNTKVSLCTIIIEADSAYYLQLGIVQQSLGRD